MRVAAIDQGTTSTRVLVVDGADRYIAHAVEHRHIYPGKGRVEHDPEKLIANVEACVKATGAVVIVWQDQRTQARIDALKAEQGLLPTVAWQMEGQHRVYALDGGVYNAGSAVNWARSIGLLERFEEIDAFDGPPAIERGLVFVPALSGLACPYWDRRAAGLWLGMTLATGRLDLVRAILEGVALRTAQVVAAMGTEARVGAGVSIDGGLSRNRYFRGFLAAALGKAIVAPDEPELTALDAAALALSASGGEIGASASPPLRIEPDAGHDEWLDRFTAAVERARNWPA